MSRSQKGELGSNRVRSEELVGTRCLRTALLMLLLESNAVMIPRTRICLLCLANINCLLLTIDATAFLQY